MKMQNEEIQNRLCFIDRTIFHATSACRSGASASKELQDYVRQLGWRSSQAQRALLAHDERGVRHNLDVLARISYRAQRAIRPADGTNYEVKSAVILTHIELSALRQQLDAPPSPDDCYRPAWPATMHRLHA